MEALSGVGEPCDVIDSSDEMDAQEESVHERTISRKKKSKRHKGMGSLGLVLVIPVHFLSSTRGDTGGEPGSGS